MSEEQKPRFELVVRVVRDDPEKTEEPKFRHVLQEIAVPIVTEWNLEAPKMLTPEAMMGMTNSDIQEQMAAPIIDQMRKAPINMMVVQCLQQLYAKLKAARAPKE